MTLPAIALPDVQNLLSAWWFDYDEAAVDRWSRYFTTDVHYASHSDSGKSSFEAVVRTEYCGRDHLVEALGNHRRNGIYPLRHLCTNLHLENAHEREAAFRGYLLVTRVEKEQAVGIATGRLWGMVRRDRDGLAIAAIAIMFDLSDSGPLRVAKGEDRSTQSA